MLKVEITKIRAHVAVDVKRRGSVLKGTVTAVVPSIATRYEIESSNRPEEVAHAVRLARQGCFVRMALSHPVTFEDTTVLNGAALQV